MRGAPRQPIVQRSCEKESASSNPSGPNEQIGSSYLDVNSLYSGVPHSASSNNFQSPPLYFVGSGGSNYDVTSQQQYKSTAPSAMCRDLFGNECQYEETGSRYEGASDHPHFACEPTGTMDERMSTAEALPTMHPGADIPYEQYVEGQEIDFLRSGNSPGADEYLLHVNRLRDSQPSLTLRLNSGPTSENLSSVMSCQEDTGHDMLIFLSGMHLRQFSDGREQNKLGDQGE
ncbi:hypothetical protein BGZ54_004633 [Gamsiella multidivaricata]|nr:hypothetical protein BGZ54_004633 [Gamsiella multidivaricata]